MSETEGMYDSAEALVREYLRTENPELREAIVKRYAGLVERVARRYMGLEPLEDLVQVGYMGLLNALSLFEPSKGVRFNTYATHLVAGSIKHHLRDRTKIIREPAWLQEVRHKVNRITGQLQQELGRPPREEEIAERAEITPELVVEVMTTEDLFKVSSLTISQSADEEGESEEIDMAQDCALQVTVEERFVLETAIHELRDLEQKVLYLFHFDSLNQAEIATKLGISANYVSHILRQSMTKLRAILNQEERNDRALRRETSNMAEDVLDDVTEAYSETYLVARLDEECARASCQETSVAFVRVQFDGLDVLARFYGSQAVDSFLRDAAEFLTSGVRRMDIVGRMGKTGFGVVLPGTGPQVETVLARLLGRVQEWLDQDSVARAGVAVRMGSAFYPEAGRTAKRLIKATSLEAIEPRREAA